jgi:hypothetical protein
MKKSVKWIMLISVIVIILAVISIYFFTGNKVYLSEGTGTGTGGGGKTCKNPQNFPFDESLSAKVDAKDVEKTQKDFEKQIKEKYTKFVETTSCSDGCSKISKALQITYVATYADEIRCVSLVNVNAAPLTGNGANVVQAAENAMATAQEVYNNPVKLSDPCPSDYPNKIIKGDYVGPMPCKPTSPFKLVPGRADSDCEVWGGHYTCYSKCIKIADCCSGGKVTLTVKGTGAVKCS